MISVFDKCARIEASSQAGTHFVFQRNVVKDVPAHQCTVLCNAALQPVIVSRELYDVAFRYVDYFWTYLKTRKTVVARTPTHDVDGDTTPSKKRSRCSPTYFDPSPTLSTPKSSPGSGNDDNASGRNEGIKKGGKSTPVTKEGKEGGGKKKTSSGGNKKKRKTVVSDDPHTFSVVKLRKLLEEYGKPKSGLQDELAERLISARLEKEGATTSGRSSASRQAGSRIAAAQGAAGEIENALSVFTHMSTVMDKARKSILGIPDSLPTEYQHAQRYDAHWPAQQRYNNPFPPSYHGGYPSPFPSQPNPMAMYHQPHEMMYYQPPMMYQGYQQQEQSSGMPGQGPFFV